AGTLVAAVRADQLALPTPCRAWDLRALLAHLVHDLRQFTVQATGGRPDWSLPAPALGDVWDAAYREGARTLLDAWGTAGDLERMVQIPGMGQVPIRFFVGQQITEFAVHGWDLATTTGRPPSELDPEIAQLALYWASRALRPEFRGDEESGSAFGPEVPIPADAPIQDRLAGFFGRNPFPTPSLG
ncbi:MAG: TIGR03086 family metal-binding protein, partial [Candidatus Dormibacteria bacterium]